MIEVGECRNLRVVRVAVEARECRRLRDLCIGPREERRALPRRGQLVGAEVTALDRSDGGTNTGGECRAASTVERDPIAQRIDREAQRLDPLAQCAEVVVTGAERGSVDPDSLGEPGPSPAGAENTTPWWVSSDERRSLR